MKKEEILKEAKRAEEEAHVDFDGLMPLKTQESNSNLTVRPFITVEYDEGNPFSYVGVKVAINDEIFEFNLDGWPGDLEKAERFINEKGFESYLISSTVHNFQSDLKKVKFN